MIRLALVGCGRHSENDHAAPLARYASEHPDEVGLAAACDLKIERAELFRGKFGFAKAYEDMNRMLDEEEIDGCVCVMPVERIVETGVELLRRHVPCVIEKPPGKSLEDARRLAEVARETGTPQMVSVNRRFIPRLNLAISWAREQGPIRHVRAAMLRHGRSEPGFVWGTGVHAVDALRHMAGEVEEFRTELQQEHQLSATWYEVSFKFENGCLGRLEILPTCGMSEETYELFGEGFRARVSCPAATGAAARGMSLQCWRNGELVLDDVAPADEPAYITDGAYDEVVGFAKALREGIRPEPSVEDVLPSAEICARIAEGSSRLDAEQEKKDNAQGSS